MRKQTKHISRTRSRKRSPLWKKSCWQSRKSRKDSACKQKTFTKRHKKILAGPGVWAANKAVFLLNLTYATCQKLVLCCQCFCFSRVGPGWSQRAHGRKLRNNFDTEELTHFTWVSGCAKQTNKTKFGTLPKGAECTDDRRRLPKRHDVTASPSGQGRPHLPHRWKFPVALV